MLVSSRLCDRHERARSSEGNILLKDIFSETLTLLDGAGTRGVTFAVPVRPGIVRTADAANGTLALLVDTNGLFKVTLYDVEP
jgi:hypothetical protein